MGISEFALEPYLWLIVLATWLGLLLLGIAGGDPLAAGRPGHEALAVAAAKWLRQRLAHRRPAPRPAALSSGHWPVVSSQT